MATTTAVPKTKISGGSFLLETRRPDEVFTPEDFSEQHQLIGQTAEEFAVNEIVPNIEKIEHKDFSVTRDLLKKAGELGLSSVEIPEAYGGLEMDKVTSAVIADHIAKYAGFATTWGGHTGIGTLPIVYFGTEEQKKKYLPRLASGEIVGAYALSESTSGSDALNCRTRATLSADGKHYVLNGEKMWITNAGFADLFTVFAKIDGEKFSAFLVEKTFPGFSIGAEEHKMGIRGSSTCPIILNECKVPVENLLGEAGKGHLIAFNILNIGRFKLGAMCVGGGRVSLENAIGYAKQRKAFNKVIADFGLVREKIANMATLLFVGESLVYRTVGLMDVALSEIDKSAADAAKQTLKAIEEYAVECSIIKVWGSEMIDYVVDETVQIFGGAGFVEDYPAQRYWRDARVYRIFEGTNEINRLLVPGTMLKRALGGRLGLMGLVGEVRQELADPIKIDRRIPDGPLGRERKKCDFAKRAIAYGASLGVQKYMQQISEKQELLGVLADCLILTFGMDSAISRTLQLVAAKGEAGSQIPIAMTQLFVAKAHEQVFDMLREMMMWMSQEEEWGREMRDINSYYNLDRVNTFSLRRRVARHVIEAGGYAL